MKVQELRDLLKTADRVCLEKAFVECYKQLPKTKKEDVDLLICDILEGKDVKESKKKETVNFEDLDEQIEDFIENANAQNYFAPNRIIPKAQRPKWRFLVKNFIKELGKVPKESENYPRMVELLTDLYHLLCEACNYYLFSTDDPFRSIGWLQSELFLMVVKKTSDKGYTREDISRLLLEATMGGLSRESLHIEQELEFLAQLGTSEVKYAAIEEAKKLIDERLEKLKGLGVYDNQVYALREGINNLCGMVLLISIALSEAETGIEYFFKNCREINKEIVLYRALDLVDYMEDDDLWIEVYKYGLVNKIKPSENLVREYEERKDR